MQRESGNKNSSIWLIGDSSPSQWEGFLDEPLDSRHPARHNIWTPVLEGIQEQVFLGDRRRVDDSQLYVRNAVHNREDRPLDSAMEWHPKLLEEAGDFGRLLGKHKPPMVFTFGAFAFEFVRRMSRKRSEVEIPLLDDDKVRRGVQTTRQRIPIHEKSTFSLSCIQASPGVASSDEPRTLHREKQRKLLRFRR